MVRTLFERIGGEEGIAALVDQLSHRLLADPALWHHFAAIGLDELKARQCRWFATVLGNVDTGEHADPAAVPAGAMFTNHDVEVMLRHLRRAVRATDTSPPVADAVVALVTRLWFARQF
jgi:hemoglobin